MQNSQFGLEWLLAPSDRTAFLSEHWEKKPFTLFRNDESYFRNVFSLADMDDILSSRELIYPTVQMVKNSAPVPPPQFASPREHKGVPMGEVVDPVKLFAEYRQGATIIMDDVHRMWPPLARLCAEIERFFNHPTQTNVYLTPPGAQGFSAHYDTHDVFILQVAGSKHWRLYPSPMQLPLAGTPFPFSGPDPGRPVSDFVLNAGDLLYLPRGHVHDAVTSDSLSLHVTLGINCYTWADLFMEALNALCKRDVRFRRSLPIGFAVDSGAIDRLRAEAASLVDALSGDSLPVVEIAQRLAERFVMSRQPSLNGYLVSLTHVRRVTPQTRIGKRAWLCRLNCHADAVRLVFHGKTLTFPRHLETTLRFIVDTNEFDVTSLPGKLSEWDKIDLVQQLIEEGVLRVVD
jgi:hypothetical protein